MPILKNNATPAINPFNVTLIFPNDKQYAWRTETDITIDPNDASHPLAALYDKRVLNSVAPETIANIQEFGVRQAVTLVEQDGKVYKLDGLGRIKAARLASLSNREKGLPEINVPYVKSTEKDAGTLAALAVSLNTHREDDSPLKKAQLCALLVERYNYTPAQAANYFKVSPTAIKQWLGVVQNAVPQVLKATESGKIAFTTAAQYAKLPADEQAAALNADLETIEGRTQVRGAKEKRLSGSEVGKPKKELTPEQITEKAFNKVVDLLEAMEPEQRLRVFARFDTTTGEEAVVYKEVEEVEDDVTVNPDDDSQDLVTVYDDEVIESTDNKPTVKRRKAAKK